MATRLKDSRSSFVSCPPCFTARAPSYLGTILLNLNWDRLTGLNDSQERVVAFFITWFSQAYLWANPRFPFPSFPLSLLPFVTECLPTVPKKWHLIEQQPLLSEIFKNRPSFHTKCRSVNPNLQCACKIVKFMQSPWLRSKHSSSPSFGIKLPC